MKKTIMLVHDYVDYLNSEKEVVEASCNVNCIAFSNPLEALWYASNENKIDVLITDYKMSQIDGFQLAKKVLEKNSFIKVIICSSYDISTLSIIAREHQLEGKVTLIKKGNMEGLINLIK